MDKIVVISLLFVAFAFWIAWLVYNYLIFYARIVIESKEHYWKNRFIRVQDCVNDLIDAIHKQFPNSTVEYTHTEEIDSIEGEIKY